MPMVKEIETLIYGKIELVKGGKGMTKNYKDVITSKYCLGILTRHTRTNSYCYLSNSDMGLQQDQQYLTREESGWFEVKCRIDFDGGYYIYYTIENDLRIEGEYTSLEQALEDIERIEGTHNE